MKPYFRKKFIIPFLVAVFIIFSSIVGFFFINKTRALKKVHYHAAFTIFKENKKLNFSEFKYMYTKPCNLNEKEEEEHEDEQLEKAHLHDNVGDVVHVERESARWIDLFKNIKYPVDYGRVKGYINGEKVENWEDQDIHPYDNLAIFIGENNISEELKLTPTKEYIQEMGQKTKTCGD